MREVNPSPGLAPFAEGGSARILPGDAYRQGSMATLYRTLVTSMVESRLPSVPPIWTTLSTK